MLIRLSNFSSHFSKFVVARPYYPHNRYHLYSSHVPVAWFTPIMSGLQASIAWSHGMFISHSTCSLLLLLIIIIKIPIIPFLTFTFFTLATRSSIFLIATYSGLFNSYRGQTVFTKILLSVVHHASVIVLASKRVNIKTSAVFSKIGLCTWKKVRERDGRPASIKLISGILP